MAKKKDPNYITVKRTIQIEEQFVIKFLDNSVHYDERDMEQLLNNGDWIIVKNEFHKDQAWIVNARGHRVAILEEDGGCGPDETVEVVVDTKNLL